MKQNLSIGDIAEIEFLDHAVDHEPLLFKVWGRIVGKSRAHYTVAGWDYSDPEDSESTEEDTNREVHAILRSTIKACHKLVRSRAKV